MFRALQAHVGIHRLQILDTLMKHIDNSSGQDEPFPVHASGLCKQVSPRKGESITLLDNVEFTASWRAMTSRSRHWEEKSRKNDGSPVPLDAVYVS